MTHSTQWPGERGSVSGGVWKSLNFSSGSSLPLPSSMPLSPMNSCERPPHSGTQPGGLLSPWCQTSFTGGAPDADAGNSYVTIIVAGASSLCGDRDVGRRRFDRQRLPDVQHRVRHVVVVAAEIAHRAVAEIPPAIPARPREVGSWNGRAGAGPSQRSK